MGTRRLCDFCDGIVCRRTQLSAHWTGTAFGVLCKNHGPRCMAVTGQRPLPDIYRTGGRAGAGALPLQPLSGKDSSILMKRWIAFAGIVLFGLGAVIVCERDNIDVQTSPAAILYFVADTEREITRMPMQLTRLPDEEEIRAGDDMARIQASAFPLN